MGKLSFRELFISDLMTPSVAPILEKTYLAVPQYCVCIIALFRLLMTATVEPDG